MMQLTRLASDEEIPESPRCEHPPRPANWPLWKPSRRWASRSFATRLVDTLAMPLQVLAMAVGNVCA